MICFTERKHKESYEVCVTCVVGIFYCVALNYRKPSGRVVTFAPHVEEFPKSPSPNYSVDQDVHTLNEEPPSQTEQSQRYHKITD